MASIIDDGDGLKRIQWVGGDGKRKTVRLGRMSKADADTFKVNVQKIVTAAQVSERPEPKVAEWLAGLDDVIFDRIAATGLIPPRGTTTLRGWIDLYVGSRSDLKASSREEVETTGAKLVKKIGASTPLRNITTALAAEWRDWLRTDQEDGGLSEATIRKHCRNAKTLFNEAVERELIYGNPFRNLDSAAVEAENEHYVTPEDAKTLIDAAPDLPWKVLIGLARLAGLRTPSETHLLTWADVDFEAGRIRVRSPKTERYAGKGERIVPMVPALAALLSKAYVQADAGVDTVVTLSATKSYLASGLRKIITTAKLEGWADAWQTLRRSCEIEWAQKYPQYAVSKWIGHSMKVSEKHYANHVPEELFERVTGCGAEAAQKAAQSPLVLGSFGKEKKKAGKTPISVNPGQVLRLPLNSSEGDGARTRNHRIDSPVLPPVLLGNSDLGGAESGAPIPDPQPVNVPVDPDLQTVVDAWADLPADVRKMVVGVVKLTPKASRTSSTSTGTSPTGKTSEGAGDAVERS